MFPRQKAFGDFIKERYGPKWVYAQRASSRITSQYPDSVVITPKQQRQLAADYRRLYGREHDPAFWAMLCVLREVQKNVSGLSVFSSMLESKVDAAIELATK